MPLPSDPAYYADCFDLFAKALLAPHGVQKVCMSWDEAYQFRQRLHKARALSRELNRKAFVNTDPRHHTSEYYGVVARIVFDEKRSVWLLRLEKRELKNEEIEEIMPAEIASKPVEVETDLLESNPEFINAILDMDLPEDEFAIQPEEDLGSSPDGASRVRRL
jgi:hypothetical protein